MRQRLLLAVTLTTLLLALAAGCGLPSDGSPRAIAEDKVPFNILSPTTAPSDNTGRQFAILYFVKDNILNPEPRRVTEFTPRALLDALVNADPPSDSRSPVKGITIKAVELDSSALLLTLGGEIPAVDQKLVFGQFVWTVTELSSVSRVRFLHEDANGQRSPLSPPTDTGNAQDRPVDRTDYMLIQPTTTTTTTTTTRPGQTSTTKPKSGG